MRKLTLALLVAYSLGAIAAPLTPEQALQRALGDNACRKISGIKGSQTMRLDCTLSASESDSAVCYVFKTSTDGFVMLSADDEAVPLLGYGDQPFDMHNIPDGLKFMLDVYADEIQHARVTAHAVHPMLNARPERAPIGPLLTTLWSQDAPYNLLCPKSQGETCPTGCVATAMAQVANYYKWPQGHGVGSNAYQWNGTTLNFNFEETFFDWESMQDTYSWSGSSLSNPSDLAVATLMYGIGVASEMVYGPYSSNASNEKALNGMKIIWGIMPTPIWPNDAIMA